MTGKINEHQLGNDSSCPSPVNFYGYGGGGTDLTDYETGCSDFEGTGGHYGYRAPGDGQFVDQHEEFRPSSSILGDHWADLSHSETEHDSDNNNKLVSREKMKNIPPGSKYENKISLS